LQKTWRCPIRAAERQKNHERFLLERFIEAAALPAEITAEREAPDFIVRVEGRTVGIEVTELFIPPREGRTLRQAQESLSARLVSRAQEIYRASGAPPVHVTALFRAGLDFRQIDRDATAMRLASFIQSLKLTSGQRHEWPPAEDDDEDDDRLQEFSYLQALGVPTYDLASWRIARAGWSAGLTADTVQSSVNQKAARLVTYQEAIAENWLVIVADRTKPSGMFRMKPDFDFRQISSPFARTFLYLYPERPIIELG